MAAPRSPMPLDYSSFTQFIQANDGRLLKLAEERRRAKLLTLFDRNLLPAPSAISVAFSPRPLDSTDLLDDLRCLIRSVEALEQENKRLRGRCAYLATVNDLLSKQIKPLPLNNKPISGSSIIRSPVPSRNNNLAKSEHVSETAPSPNTLAPHSPPPSAPAATTATVMQQSVLVHQHSTPYSTLRDDLTKNDQSSSRLTSFGAKMSKAATKLLSRPRKLGGASLMRKASLRITPTVEKEENPPSGLQQSSSNSSLVDPNSLAQPRSKSFEKQQSLALDNPPESLSSTNSVSIADEQAATKRQRYLSAKEPRPRCGSESHHARRIDDTISCKSEDELDNLSEQYGSPDPYSHPLLCDSRSVRSAVRMGSPVGSCMETYESNSPMLMSTDSLGVEFSCSHGVGLPSVGDNASKKAAPKSNAPLPATRARAWTWDVTVRTAAAKPWHRLKQLLRRASTPSETSGTVGVLNDTVTAPVSQRLANVVAQRQRAAIKARNTDKKRHKAPPVPPANSPAKSCLKMPSTTPQQNMQQINGESLARTLHLLALTESGGIVEQQEKQRKQISKALACIKADEDDDAKLADLEVVQAMAKVDEALGHFVDGLWNDFRASLAENCFIKRAYLSDRLKLLEWANAHCSRLLNDDRQQQQDGHHGVSSIRKRHSFRINQQTGNDGDRTRYHESTGLCYGKPGGNQQQSPGFKARKLNRRWFSIGAGDRLSPAQRDVSCRLATSICALFSSLEPITDLSPTTKPLVATRSESLGILLQEAQASLAQKKTVEVQRVVSAPTSPPPSVLPLRPQSPMPTPRASPKLFGSPLIERKPEIPPEFKAPVPSEHGSKTGTPTSLRTPRSVRAMQSRSLSREEPDKPTPKPLESVTSQPSVAVATNNEHASPANSIFSPTIIANRKYSHHQLVLMSADELMRVARSRSASVCTNTGMANSLAVSMCTSPSLTGVNSSKVSLVDKRRSIAEMESFPSTMRRPSLAAIAIAMDFVKIARQRAASTGSQGRRRSRVLKEPDLPAVVMSPTTMSPATSERSGLPCSMSQQTSFDRNVSPTPPLLATSPTSSTRTLDSNSLTFPPQLPAVQRVAPIITVSPDHFSPTHGSRGRIKSLIELSATTPIGRIFGNGKNPIALPACRSAPNRSPSPTNVSSSMNSSTSTNAATSGLLCPPPIFTEPSSELEIVTTPEPHVSSKPSPSSSSKPPPAPAPQPQKPPSKLSWFNRFLKKSPSPLKRFSSCGVGPESINESVTLETPGSPPFSLRSLSPTVDPSPSMSPMKRFFKKDPNKTSKFKSSWRSSDQVN